MKSMWIQWRRGPGTGGLLTSKTWWHRLRSDGMTVCGQKPPSRRVSSPAAPPISGMCCHCGWGVEKPAAPRRAA